MINSKTLKTRMLVGGIAAVLIPFFIIGLIVYGQLSKSLLELTMERAVHHVEDAAERIETVLKQKIELARSIAADPDIIAASRNGAYATAQKELESIYQGIGRDYFTIFLLDQNGIARADARFPRQIGTDLSDRDYFLKAKQGRANVGGPLPARGSATPGASVIIVSAPILDKGRFYGMVGIPFNNDFVINSFAKGEFGTTGFTFLIDSEGVVLMHPQEAYNFKLRFLDQPGTEGIKRLAEAKTTGATSYRTNRLEKIAGLAHVATTGWTVVFSQDRQEAMAPMTKILSLIIICAVTFCIVIIVAINIYTNRIGTPVQEVMEVVNQVTQHSAEMIMQMGVDRRIVSANPAFEEVTGLKAERIIGTEPDLSGALNASADQIWDALESGIPWSGRLRFQKNADLSLTLDVMFVPLRDSSGAIGGYLEIGRDITDELMVEKRLQQAQKMEAIGTLAGGIAHDFNNILSGILGYAELALMETTNNPETETYMREVIRASERARALVNQILTFSRQTEVNLRPISVKPILKEALKLLRASLPATVAIEANLTSDAVIMAEPTQIHQIIMNLFTNAVHAIADRCGTITLWAEDFMVDEEFAQAHPGIRPGNHLRLAVADTGGGIAPHLQDQIFLPFFTTKSQGEGTGLGLSVVHGIISKIGGIITVSSTEGQGTRFDIVIPVCASGDAGEGPNTVCLTPGNASIAVIDDEETIAAVIRAILRNVGYHVTAFTDGMAALKALRSDPEAFDVVITDYAMPQTTGLEIAKALKESGIRIPMILITGYINETIEKAARATGIAELIIKPINAYQLTDAIQRVLTKAIV